MVLFTLIYSLKHINLQTFEFLKQEQSGRNFYHTLNLSIYIHNILLIYIYNQFQFLCVVFSNIFTSKNFFIFIHHLFIFSIKISSEDSYYEEDSQSSEQQWINDIETAIKDRTQFNRQISTIQGCIVESQNWIKDEDVDECIICHSKFNLINRRHHCRRCGRIVCKDCLGKESVEKLCIICSELITQQDNNFDPQQLNSLLSNRKIIEVINCKDFLLQGEVIRLYQNLITTDQARLQLKQRWPELFIQVFQLCRKSIDKIGTQNKEKFFQLEEKQEFDAKTAQITILPCLGIIQNYTSSSDEQFASDLIKFDPMGLIVQLFDQELDLAKQELCAQILRNLCRNKDLCKLFIQNEEFNEIIDNLFNTKVDQVRLVVIQLFSVIQIHYKQKLIEKLGDKKNKVKGLNKLIQMYREVRSGSQQSQTAASATTYGYLVLSAYSDDLELKQILQDNNIFIEMAQTIQRDICGIAQMFAANSLLQVLENNQDDDEFCVELINNIFTKTGTCNMIEGHKSPSIKELLYYGVKYYRDEIKALKSKTVFQKAEEILAESEDEHERKIFKYIQKLRK